ncbi:unnamed protein product [Onchocerca flexuosa]|uniref:CUB domain-containing protein n=1 Tax=Onchocerca flexuosa TaxID=387005 RepID=A0A183GZ16_9BILA|nr:unnamed protein product [Onchocerca flexuosa]
MTCYVFSVGRSDASVKSNPSTDFYEFNCGESIFEVYFNKACKTKIDESSSDNHLLDQQ